MPTISQLPSAVQITAADEVPLSQQGTARSISVGTLLEGTQPAIMAPTGVLLGRTSLGPGGPEPIDIGPGLHLDLGVLAATGAEHANFAMQTRLVPGDQAILNSGGTPKLLELSLLRGLFSAGANIAVDPTGTISVTGLGAGQAGVSVPYNITGLPLVPTIVATDLLGISQGGVDRAITYENLLDGQTIDRAQPAGSAADTDTLWVGQSGSTMLRQTWSAMWVWISTKLQTYKTPTVEVTTNTTLDGTVHNAHVLICSQPVTLSPISVNMGDGFCCDVINLSAGSVTFGGGIVSSSGSRLLPAGQAATLRSATYSGGSVIYATVSGPGMASSVPGQVVGLFESSVTTTSVTLSWPPLSPPASSYNVQYRMTGTTTWSAGISASSPACAVSGLVPGSSYDFTVSGVNGAGVGMPSAILTTATSAGVNLPGQISGLVASGPTSTSVTLNWLEPTSGGPSSSYTVQYRGAGTTAWITSASGVAVPSLVVAGLTTATTYNFQVFAVNAAGAGAPSVAVTATTGVGSAAVSSANWNVAPFGSYSHGSGAIGVNAHVSPATAAVQFGFSTSAMVPPSSWTVASLVNTDLWGAYVPTPTTVGTWYAWVEGTDGSTPTVYATGFTVI